MLETKIGTAVGYGLWIRYESENLREPIAYVISVDSSVYNAYVFSLSFFLWIQVSLAEKLRTGYYTHIRVKKCLLSV